MKACLKIFLSVFALAMVGQLHAQIQPDLQYFRANDKDGLNVYEPSKDDNVEYDGFKIRIGGDFAMQFQGLDQTNSGDSLQQLGSNFNLPTANLSLDVQLFDGMRVHFRTYLSARHHPESWVKGGHLQIDKLDFIKEGFLENIMKYTRITIGMDEFNYGDAHFRRSDNARAIFNPFVGNYIMDAFSTEAFGEVTVMHSGFIGVIGLTNGKLNQSVEVNDNTDNKISFYGKLGYDKQLSDDFRLRLTGSWYINNGRSTGFWLYNGDRAGTRYYSVLYQADGSGSDFDGRVRPRFNEMTAFQINPFIKYKGLEFFGIFEIASDGDDNGGEYTQLAAELLYRFGSKEQIYVGGRYNVVTGNPTDNAGDEKVDRINFGAGWYMTKNVLAKAEYVRQTYSDPGFDGSYLEGAEFDGIVIEAVISF